jgi:histidinol-phosphate/aromatic aminotransferase/cobyric acid decarboxylase-like protein
LDNPEHERFYSRLATLPEVDLMPSVGSWILMRVADPEDLMERLNKRLYDGAVSLPHGIPGALRIPVRDAKENERVLAAIVETFRGSEDEDDDEESGDD